METYWNAGHIEVFKDGSKMMLKADVQLTAVSIKLTSANTEILFTSYITTLFFLLCVLNIASILQVYHKRCVILHLSTDATQSATIIFNRWKGINSHRQLEKGLYIKILITLVKMKKKQIRFSYNVNRYLLGEKYVISLLCDIVMYNITLFTWLFVFLLVCRI